MDRIPIKTVFRPSQALNISRKQVNLDFRNKPVNIPEPLTNFDSDRPKGAEMSSTSNRKCRNKSDRFRDVKRSWKGNSEHSAVRSQMLNLRKVVSPSSEYEVVVGHDAVKDAIENAFLQANCMDFELNSKLSLQTFLLVGVPGIGKTDIMCNSAAKIEKLIKHPISVFVVSAADLLSKYIGQSEKTVSALWDVVEEFAPSLVLLDEVDSLMKSRNSEESEHSRRFKNQLLSQMEGTRLLQNVVTLAATNRGQELDDAFLRRFKLKFLLRPPNNNERLEILYKFLHLGNNYTKLVLTKKEEIQFVKETTCFTGDDIRSVVSYAVTRCLRVKHNGRMYETKMLHTIRNELEECTNPPVATLDALTVDILFLAIKDVKPSCNAAELRKLNRWAHKRCTESCYPQNDLKMSTAEPHEERTGCFTFLHLC